MKARARNSDPATSRQAAGRMNAHITEQGAQVLSLLGKRPLTASQLEARANLRGEPVDRYTISRRLPDLEAAGAVKRMGQARCPIRGVPMLLWALS